jgi:hypothetical protein
MRARSSRYLALLAAVCLSDAQAAAITLGQIDNFYDGTTQGWTGGTSLSNQPTGGPGGTGDRYLQLNSGGGSLGTYNLIQWSGNYAAAGVTRVNIDLKNFGPAPVSMRLMLFTPGCAFGGTGCTAWSQRNATVLPPGSGWVKVEFSLAEADLVPVLGGASYAASMANVERIHLKHDPGVQNPPGYPNPPQTPNCCLVDAVLGMDNVIALPEPSWGAGLLAGVLSLLLVPQGQFGTRRKSLSISNGKRIPC